MRAATQRRSRDHPANNFDEEFTCPVCLDLMVQPTMLPCGHNLCHLCLAKSTLVTGRRTCSTCQQGWQGRPAVNLALRNMIERMHRVNLARRGLRTMLVDLDETRRVLTTFSTAVHEAEKKTKEIEAGTFVLFGIAIAACVVLAVPFALHYWYATLMYPGDPLTQMPVMAWRSSDVTLWLENMGWTRDYVASVHQHSINGAMLLGMDETDIVQLLNMTDKVHQNALQVAIQNLHQASLKMPENVWEYLEIYPGRVHFLFLCLLQAPRSTMVFMYLFYYEEMFLPFLQTTTPLEWDKQPETLWGKLPDPSKSQWVDFAFLILVLPFWKIVVFAWGYRWQHYFLLLYVIPRSFWDSFQEICLCLRVSLGWNVGYPYNTKQTVDDIIFRLFMLLTWPVIPLFALNGLFYLITSFATLANGWAICYYLRSKFGVY